MKKHLLRIAGVLVALSAPLFVSGVVRAAVDTCTWTGGGADNNFSTIGNWSGCDGVNPMPEQGDSLEFPANIAVRTIVNDLTAGYVINNITFSGAASQNSIYSISGNAIELSGNITNSMTGTSINQTINLPITLGANSTFNAGITTLELGGGIDLATYDLSLSGTSIYSSGIISGSGNISSSADFTNLYGQNTYTGTLSVTAGSLHVRDQAGLGANSAGTTLSGTSVMRFCPVGSADVSISEPLTINGTEPGSIPKIFIASNCSSVTSASTHVAGPYVNLTGPVALGGDYTTYGEYWDLKLSGALSGTGSSLTVPEGQDFELVVSGSSNTTDTANGTYVSALKTYSITTNQSGTPYDLLYNNLLSVTASGTVGDVTLWGGTLKGSGTVGEIIMSLGKVAPGLSPGCLNSGNLTYTGGTVEIEINGATVCTEYDQQVVTGTVSLGSATTLSIMRLASYAPTLNTSFTIITNDSTDAVTGTFAGLAQGATTTVDGYTYTISYSGGDGNDVVLTVTGVPTAAAAPDTGTHVIKSGVLLPVFAIVSALAIFGLNYQANKRK